MELVRVVLGDGLAPQQPLPPAVLQPVGRQDVHRPAAGPVAAPPGGAVEAPERGLPEGPQMLRRFTALDLLGQGRDDDPDPAARRQQPGQRGQVQVVGAEVLVGVDGDDRVEGLRAERQVVRLREDGLDAVGDARLGDPAGVLVRLDPQVRGGDLDVVLPGEEDGGHGAAAAQVEHPGAGTQGVQAEGGGQPLQQPQRVRAHLVVDGPLRVVGAAARVAGQAQAASEVVVRGVRCDVRHR